MSEQIVKKREHWATRINLEPDAQDAVKAMAKARCISVATLIGTVLESYITSRSTS